MHFASVHVALMGYFAAGISPRMVLTAAPALLVVSEIRVFAVPHWFQTGALVRQVSFVFTSWAVLLPGLAQLPWGTAAWASKSTGRLEMGLPYWSSTDTETKPEKESIAVPFPSP